jgi:signal transduction histidine kinase
MAAMRMFLTKAFLCLRTASAALWVRCRMCFAEVSVKEKGFGLPNEVMTHLFSAYRPSSTGGLGVGLSISRTIIEAHGGKIWAENNDDEGASFHFEVPTG